MHKMDLNEIIDIAKKHKHHREGGKTAIVVSRDIDYGISRMYETLSEIADQPYRI